MASEVGIVNQGIGFIGGNRITALTDKSPEAILANDLYADLRDACLEEADWTFAVKGFVLPQSNDEVPFGAGRVFPLRDEIIRVIHVNENKYPWVLEGRKIIVESGRCEALCIIRIVDVNKMSPMFRQALAARLAWDMALPITNSKTMHDTMFQLYQQKIAFAKTNDGMQGTTQRIRSQRFLERRGSDGTNIAGPYV